jgi:hypothetical protein
MIQKVCKVFNMRAAGLTTFGGRYLRARSDAPGVGAAITSGEAVVTRSGGS